MSDSLNCKIVQDLMPNYIEGLTNEYTNTVMREHLEGCNTCRRTYELLSQDEKKSVESNIKEAKKLKWYMKKIKIISLFLGIIIATTSLFGSYVIYNTLFNNVNYFEPSSNVEVTELYKINDDYIYFTIKDNSKYKYDSFGSGSMTVEDNTIMYLSFSRTTVGEKYDKKLTEEERVKLSSLSFVFDIKNNKVINLDVFINNNQQATGNEILKYINEESNEKGINEMNTDIDGIYYVGKGADDKLLIWQEGMELPQYPY